VPDDGVVVGGGVLADVPVTQAVFTVNSRGDRRKQGDDLASVLPLAEDDSVRGFGSFRMRSDPKALVFGLNEFTDPGWQSWWGMMKTPFVNPSRQSSGPHTEEPEPAEENNLTHAGRQ
jgi:hypothetical protein